MKIKGWHGKYISRLCVLYVGGESISASSFVPEEIYQLLTRGGENNRKNEHALGCMC